MSDDEDDDDDDDDDDDVLAQTCPWQPFGSIASTQARSVESYSVLGVKGVPLHPLGFMSRFAKSRYQTKSLNKIGYQKSNQN